MESFSEADFDFEDGSAGSGPASADPSHPSDDFETTEDVAMDNARRESTKPPLDTGFKSASQTPQAAKYPTGMQTAGLVDPFSSLDISGPATPTRDASASLRRTRTDSTALTLRARDSSDLPDTLPDTRPADRDSHAPAIDDSFHEVGHEDVQGVAFDRVHANDGTADADGWIATESPDMRPTSTLKPKDSGELVLVDLDVDHADTCRWD